MKNEKEIWDSYNNLLLSDDISRLRKIFARYELYKKTASVPGDIIECGVFKGSGIFTWVKLVKLFKPNNNFKTLNRLVVLFIFKAPYHTNIINIQELGQNSPMPLKPFAH